MSGIECLGEKKESDEESESNKLKAKKLERVKVRLKEHENWRQRVKLFIKEGEETWIDREK